MGKGAMGASFAFEKDPADILELDGKEAIQALQDLTPFVTKTMQVYSEAMFKLIQTADKTADGLQSTQESHLQEVQNLDFKLQAFQGEYDGTLKEQNAINVEWEARMKKVEAVISGMPAWKDDIVNIIHSSKRADDARYGQLMQRVTDAENEHAILKEDVLARVGKLEEFKERVDQTMTSFDRRLKVLEEDMVKMMTDNEATKKEHQGRFHEVEEQMGAIQVTFSKFNHEAKLLEAAHEELKNATEAEHFKLNEQLQLAGQERQQLSQDIKFVKQCTDEGDERLHNRLDALQPLLHDLEDLKGELTGMKGDLEQSIGDMEDVGDDSSAPPPTQENSGSSLALSVGPAKGKKLKNIARMAASAASMRSGSRPGTPSKGGVAGGLSFMMNYLKERIEGITEHSIQQDNEIGDLQTKTGEIILDLMRLRKTEDEMVVIKTKIREHHDMISRNKSDISNNQARQSEEDQQIYALIEKRAAESVKNSAMDIKGARAELVALCDHNMSAIKDVKENLAKLSGQARASDAGSADSAPVLGVASAEQTKKLEEQAKAMAALTGKLAVYDEKINAHEQRLTDQGAQIYDISAKVLTELDKELNGIRDEIRDKTSMLQQEVLKRPTESDVKEIFTALKMGMMGETASHELKTMMEQLLQASKAHLPGEKQPAAKTQSTTGPMPAIAGTPDNSRAPHIHRMETERSNETAALINSMIARLDQLIDRPHSCVDSLVLYNHLLTARMDELQHNHGVVLKRIGNVQREAAMAFDEIAKVGQNPTGEAPANKGQERAIKRLEAAVRELARMQMAQGERDSVMLGTKSREQNGEVFKCLSCDNNPVSLNDMMQRSSVDVLPLMPSAAPQTYIGRDKLNYPDKVRAAAASPDSALSKGKVYSSSPISQPPPLYQETSAEEVHGGGEGGKTANDGGTPKAAIHSPNPAALSTSSQQDGAVSMRMESFAPISDMPPPQFHTRTRDLRREAAVRNSADSLPAINPTGRVSQERPTSAS